MANGIGQTRGGRNTKLHAVCDAKGRPCVLLLTPGNAHDMRVAQQCIAAMPPSAELVGDKGYDSNDLRAWLASRGAVPAIVQLREGESIEERTVRYRTVGDMSCTGAIDSTAATVAEVIAEVAVSTITERGATRADDRLTEAAMEDRKREGYF